MNAATKQRINEAQVRNFFAAWAPAWRWVLIVGLRDLRANLRRLGEMAATEMDNDSWKADDYVYGPLALGITAAAVNEAAQHCEDLFALLTFARDPMDFVKRMTSYAAGKVTGLSKRLMTEGDDGLRKRFLLPPTAVIEDGLSKAEDPEKAVAAVEEAVKRLLDLVRKVTDWYLTYEFFHLQYKHGFKLPLRPFSGTLPPETIDKRKQDVSAPLIAFTNENLAQMLARPPGQQALMMLLTPETQPHINELIADRALLRYQMSGPEVNLDDVVEISRSVYRLLFLIQRNRLSVSNGPDEDGQQVFYLPGAAANETVEARLEPSTPVLLKDFR
jgi:hypothetical protein